MLTASYYGAAQNSRGALSVLFWTGKTQRQQKDAEKDGRGADGRHKTGAAAAHRRNETHTYVCLCTRGRTHTHPHNAHNAHNAHKTHARPRSIQRAAFLGLPPGRLRAAQHAADEKRTTGVAVSDWKRADIQQHHARRTMHVVRLVCHTLFVCGFRVFFWSASILHFLVFLLALSGPRRCLAGWSSRLESQSLPLSRPLALTSLQMRISDTL